jgi:preprotein translocase subunit SecE
MSAVKEKPEGDEVQESSFLAEFFRADIYKRNQGRITRQATGFAIAIAVLVGVYTLWQRLPFALAGRLVITDSLGVAKDYGEMLALGICIGIALVGCWIAYRVVNLPVFADFLIAVEAEMNKVTWPSEGEVYRATGVVIFVMFALAAVLYAFDGLWMFVFAFLGVTPW